MDTIDILYKFTSTIEKEAKTKCVVIVISSVIDLILLLSWFLRYLINISGHIEYNQCSIMNDHCNCSLKQIKFQIEFLNQYIYQASLEFSFDTRTIFINR